MADEERGDGNNWFRRHILEKLDDLGAGQKSLLDAHQRSIESLVRANADHAEADAQAFREIRKDLESFRPVKQIVFAGVGIILAIVLGALIAQITDRRSDPAPVQFDRQGTFKQKENP